MPVSNHGAAIEPGATAVNRTSDRERVTAGWRGATPVAGIGRQRKRNAINGVFLKKQAPKVVRQE